MLSPVTSVSELELLHLRKEDRMNLHRTNKGSHTIMKPSSSSSTSTSGGSNNSSSSSGSGSVGPQHHHHHHRKQPPVIRVIHIFNPTVIKTDVANFRSLVQELTGKKTQPVSSNNNNNTSNNSNSGNVQKNSGTVRRPSSVYDCQMTQLQATANDFISPKPQFTTGAPQVQQRHRVPSTYASVPTKRTPIYIPERLGTFNDLEDIVSTMQDSPLFDFSSLLPPLGELRHEDSLLPRFTSVYESF